MYGIKEAITGVKSVVSIIGSIVALTIFVYAASDNASDALAQNKEQDKSITALSDSLQGLKEEQSKIRTDVALTKQASQRTEKDISEIKDGMEEIRHLLMKSR